MKKRIIILTSVILVVSILMSLMVSVFNASADVYIPDTDTANPFFETTLQNIRANVEGANKTSINENYDTFETLPQDTNYMSLGTSTYANINGKTVTTEGFYRVKNQASLDPNYGAGILLYQCILYKIAHPNEDVSVSFSTYRFAPSAAVCVLPESKYYGYMRSLYEENYDQHGFVRVSYMLVEAARMGIDVTIVLQLNGYSVKQYNATGALKSRSELKYTTYFTNALKTYCYDKYEKGKKVSDFMNYKSVAWTLSDKGSTDMMHLKACAVSNHMDDKGVVKGPAVWFSSSNLDAIDYRGANGNNGSQSGVVVANHYDLYKVTRNYIKLMADYHEQEALYELRDLVNTRNTQQAALIRSGRGNEIADDEQIVYVGTESDKVFRLYFTPIGGGINTWDLENNAFCYYTTKLAQSKDYMEFTWNNATFTKFWLSNTLMEMVENAYHKNKNPENKIHIKLDSYDLTKFDDLKVGVDIGYKSVQDGTGIHAKDLIMSYKDAEDNQRHYVSILSSCNFHLGALSYQTNSILVIDETDATGNSFYKNFGDTYSYGMIENDEKGKTFDGSTRYAVETKTEQMPTTFEAVIQLQASSTDSQGVILGTSDNYSSCINYEIYKDNPRVYFKTPDKKVYDCIFTNVNVVGTKPVHLAITHDVQTGNLYCYVNGVLKQTLEGKAPKERFIPNQRFVVGSDFRTANLQYFKGELSNVALWSDVRNEEEILQDYNNSNVFKNSLDIADEKLLFAFDLTDEQFDIDLSENSNNLHQDVMWNDEVEPVGDYDYSFAVVGDTQEHSEDMPEQFAAIYDWIVENKEAHNIQYVLGLGDITQNSYDEEWTYAKKVVGKLDGVVPYSLTRGNHDGATKFNNTFGNMLSKQVDGCFIEGDYTNAYKAFTVGQTKYLLLCIDFGPSDDMLAWANDIISQYPDHRVIITTHQYMYRDGTTLDGGDAYPASKYPGRVDNDYSKNRDYNDGDVMWEELVSKHENIVLVLSGHDPFDQIVYRQDEGVNGNLVTQMLIDPQNLDNNLRDTGMIAMFYFSEGGNKLTVRYYSITRKQFGTSSSQFTIDLVK